MEFKTVDEVCALLKARGFDDAVLQEFRGELSETWHCPSAIFSVATTRPFVWRAVQYTFPMLNNGISYGFVS